MVAITTYALVAIVKKRMKLDMSLYTILQVLGATLFEKTPILQVLTGANHNITEGDAPNQLILFDLRWGSREIIC